MSFLSEVRSSTPHVKPHFLQTHLSKLFLPMPLLRTVRLTFHPERLDAFHALFAETRGRIAAAPGCRSLELWQDVGFPNVLTTVSLWDAAAALDAYRASDLFRETWARTTPLFAAPPVARSHVPATPPDDTR